MLLRMAGITAVFFALGGCAFETPNCNGCARDSELHVNDIVTVARITVTSRPSIPSFLLS
jgi:hypothetical protein